MFNLFPITELVTGRFCTLISMLIWYRRGGYWMKHMRINLQNNFVLLTFIVVSVSIFITDYLIERTLADLNYQAMYEEAMEIADISASNPIVIDALMGKEDRQK